MINMPVEQIIEKIKKEKGLSEEEIKKKIDAKLEELSGLISEQGAAHIVANEMDVKLFDIGGSLKIKNILAGMRNVECVGKVIAKFDINEFQSKKGPGKVGSCIIGDETGTIRLVFWNEKTEKMKEFEKGDILKIKFGYVRNNQGNKEIHIGDKSEIQVNPEGEKIEDVKRTEHKRKKINELKEDESNVEILGTIVQAMDTRFWPACPECGKKLNEENGTYKCDEHGEKEPKYSYVSNIILDDGTGNIRVVLFKNQLLNLSEKEDKDIQEMRTNQEKNEQLKNELIGKIVKIKGNIKKNDFFDRIEMVARFVDSNPDPEKELEKKEE